MVGVGSLETDAVIEFEVQDVDSHKHLWKGRHGSRNGQRKKLNCDASPTKPLPTLQRAPEQMALGPGAGCSQEGRDLGRGSSLWFSIDHTPLLPWKNLNGVSLKDLPNPP